MTAPAPHPSADPVNGSRVSRTWRLPRALHPGAWWLWALGLAAAATRTTNPLLLLLIAAVAGYVVWSRRTAAPWAHAYGAFLKLGLTVLVLRVVIQVLLGAPVPGEVLVTLPEVPLPDWMAGVKVGGAITLAGLAAAVYDGLRLAVLLACVGAANALANPTRLLRSLPAALYELGVAVTVALSLAPQLLASVSRLRATRRLRGHRDRGLRGLRTLAVPILEGAMERSVALAAAMDSRGYGRRGTVSPGRRRLTATLTVGGLLGALAGVYGLLDANTPGVLGVPLLLLGTGLAVAGLLLGGRRSPRTRYRPDPWLLPEWLTAAAGVAAAVVLTAGAAAGVTALHPLTIPLSVPTVPLPAALAILAALLPAWVTPPPPRMAVTAR